jgi:hypothetical protein
MTVPFPNNLSRVGVRGADFLEFNFSVLLSTFKFYFAFFASSRFSKHPFERYYANHLQRHHV